MGKRKPVTDHLGITYTSITEMCNHYGIESRLFHDRIKRGFTISEALGQHKRINLRLYTLSELADTYNIDKEKLRLLLDRGFTIPEIKNIVAGKMYIDPNGVAYKSFNAMCNAWGKNASTIRNRMKKGLSLEEALEK